MLVILNKACCFSVSVDGDRILVKCVVWKAPFPVQDLGQNSHCGYSG
jgi:hypothetical protein